MSTPVTLPPGKDSAPSASGEAARPRSVTIAAALLVVQATVGLADVALSLAFRSHQGAAKLIVNPVAQQLSGHPTHLSPLGLAYAVLLPTILLFLAVSMLRGSRHARLAALVLSGFGALAFLVNGVLSVPYQVEQPVPQWYLEYGALVSLLAVTIPVAIVVALALRPSIRYFALGRA